MECEDENYDFEERAAIREYDAGYPRDVAEFLARDEIEVRIAQQGCLNRKQQYEKEQTQNKPRENHHAEQRLPRERLSPVPERPELQSLQSLRDKISNQINGETNEQRKKELFAKWLDLCKQIIDLRKES